MNTRLIAGTPLEILPYNVTGNGERESVEKSRDWEISSQASEMTKVQRLGESRREEFPEMPGPSIEGEDIVYSSQKREAAETKIAILYQYQNKVSGRKYYGISTNPKQRQASHRYYAVRLKTPFYDAVKKYGWEGFEYTVLAEDSEEKIALMEIEAIANDPNCYNLHKGGHIGYDVSKSSKAKEWKRKLKAVRVGKKPALGMKHSEETKKLCGLYGKARWDKYGRYPNEVLDYGFTEANKKFGISKTHYYRLRKAVQD